MDACLVPGCVKGGKLTRGMCRMHYDRWLTKGDPGGAGELRPRKAAGECQVDGCDGKYLAQGMCNKHYMRWKRYGDPLGSAPAISRADRFWSMAGQRGPGDCWLWAGYIRRDGYGGFRDDRGPGALAHRFSWELANGPIPDGLEIDHLCRNRACVNPAHLQPVTSFVNTVIRGMARSSLNYRKTHCVNGHEFTPENTAFRQSKWVNGTAWRACLTCRRERNSRGRKSA